MQGAMGKRFNYFMSAFFRLLCFLACLIAFVVVVIVVKPAIVWLNVLLICLSIGGLISGVFNILLCGMTATGYNENKSVQIICLIVTIITGGLLGTLFTSIALATKISKEEIDNEKLITIKKQRIKKEKKNV